MVGEGKMMYASGHERIGIMDNDEWTGEAVYLEVIKHCHVSKFSLSNLKFLGLVFRDIHMGH